VHFESSVVSRYTPLCQFSISFLFLFFLIPNNTGSDHDTEISACSSVSSAENEQEQSGQEPAQTLQVRQSYPTPKNFAERMMNALETGIGRDAISWVGQGRAVALNSNILKENPLLTTYFKAKDYSGFIRNCNRWYVFLCFSVQFIVKFLIFAPHVPHTTNLPLSPSLCCFPGDSVEWHTTMFLLELSRTKTRSFKESSPTLSSICAWTATYKMCLLVTNPHAVP